jgi:hypothetical protein
VRDPRRANLIIVVSLLMIAVAFAIYASMVLRWFSSPGSGMITVPASRESSAAAHLELEAARREFRERFLDPRAHMRLSEALWKAGLPVDSFYVMYAARQLFPDDAFRQAHAEVVVGVGGPAAAIRSRLKGLRDPALTIPIHAETARDYPDSPEARDSLEQLSQMAIGDPNLSGGEAVQLARTALEELYRQDPKSPDKLAALAGAALGRGDAATANALALEALNKFPNHAGAARVLGMLALKDRDVDGARKWLSAAWEKDSTDLYSAAKLAQIYDKRRGEPEEALPFYLALYHENPDYEDGEPAETRIRATLDFRRERLLKQVGVDGIGARLKLDDASLRAQACARAADFKDPRWIDALGERLDDDAEIVRRNADYALYQIAKAEPGAVRVRRDAWLSSDRPLLRIRALNLFADLDGMNALPSAVKALSDPNPAARAFAVAMVLDYYYPNVPEAAKARARFMAAEKDPAVLDFIRRHPAQPR